MSETGSANESMPFETFEGFIGAIEETKRIRNRIHVMMQAMYELITFENESEIAIRLEEEAGHRRARRWRFAKQGAHVQFAYEVQGPRGPQYPRACNVYDGEIPMECLPDMHWDLPLVLAALWKQRPDVRAKLHDLKRVKTELLQQRGLVSQMPMHL